MGQGVTSERICHGQVRTHPLNGTQLSTKLVPKPLRAAFLGVVDARGSVTPSVCSNRMWRQSLHPQCAATLRGFVLGIYTVPLRLVPPSSRPRNLPSTLAVGPPPVT
eukprot:350850-Chlamydomonas_euryale.AAC.2